jgi:HSP20 family protein
MLTRRWAPFTEMNRLREEVDRVFGHGLGFYRDAGVKVFPLLNVWQDEEHYYVEAEMPGVNPEQVEIHVTGGNQLTIKGERKTLEPSAGVWHRRERGYGSFSRTIELAGPVNVNDVVANYKDGVMTITLAKSVETKPKRIHVSVAS